VPALAALIDAGHRVRRVYSQPPKPAGRGQKLTPGAVHQFAEARGIPVVTPRSLKDKVEQESFAALNLDAAVVAAYGLLLPKPILDAPRLGCLNVHPSLLPRWRGAAPIHRAILAGDAETGVAIMRMDEGLDTGPVLLEERTSIAATDTAKTLHDRLAAMGARLIVQALARLEKGALTATPQPSEGVVYAARLKREEGRLDWTRPAVELARLVRAFAPWPGAWFEHKGERIKVLEAEAVQGSGTPGTVLEGLTIACSEGALAIRKVQRAGKGAMTADAFLRGFALPPGTVL
jgi:methionyl-tRNA formyltransferase